MRRRFGYTVALFIILIVVTSFTACGFRGVQNDEFYSSNGQRIYFTATSQSGKPIIPEGFTMMMRRIACVDCHGPKAKGGTAYMMMERFDVPNITWPELTGVHEDHQPYTEATIKTAITEGIDPAGHALEDFMPRWQISEQDLDDLIGYLKMLN